MALYALLYLAAVTAGLPIGFALFGRRQAGGWIAGALVGYALTAFALWTPIAAHAPSVAAFVLAWLVLSSLTWGLTPRREEPSVRLPPWTPEASAALVVVLAITLAIAAPPLLKVGQSDSE